MSSIAHRCVTNPKEESQFPSHGLQALPAALALRIPAWGHSEDRPGQGKDFQSDFGHATDR